MAKPRRYEDVVDEDLQDAAEAAGYLNACLEDGEPDGFLLALRDVACAGVGMAKLAEVTELNRKHLYRMLSEDGNPELRSLEALLAALASSARDSACTRSFRSGKMPLACVRSP